MSVVTENIREINLPTEECVPQEITLPEERQMPRGETQSKELNKLFEALAKAQLEMDVAKTESVNPYFRSRYADLASVVKASRASLAKQGLSVIHRTFKGTFRGEGWMMAARLCHSSGQWIESVMNISPPKSDIQSLGSYLTYLRRYLYCCLTGTVAGDEDDDGEKAMEPARKEERKPSAPARISKPQLNVISTELEGMPEIVSYILGGYKIKKLSDLLAKDYTKCIERIREIKRAKGGV